MKRVYLQNGNSVPNCTFWMMAFSTALWPAILTSCWFHPVTWTMVFCPPAGFANRRHLCDRADAMATADHLSQTFLLHLNKPVLTIRRSIVVENPPTRPIVFCGIARPAIFLSQLRAAGIEPAGEMVFRDHHRYGPRDVQSLQKLRGQRQANGFITTEKDAINLREQLGSLGPIAIAQVTMELDDSANAVDAMLRMISSRSPRHEKILSAHE